MNELLSVGQALSYLRISHGTLYKLIREGEIKTVKVFSRTRGALDDFLRRKLRELKKEALRQAGEGRARALPTGATTSAAMTNWSDEWKSWPFEPRRHGRVAKPAHVYAGV